MTMLAASRPRRASSNGRRTADFASDRSAQMVGAGRTIATAAEVLHCFGESSSLGEIRAFAPTGDAVGSDRTTMNVLPDDAGSGVSTFQHRFAELRRCKSVRDGWDGEGAPRPTHSALRIAERILERLHAEGFAPDRVMPSVEGGVAIVFCRNGRYADFECFNDGDILVAISDRESQRSVWQTSLTSRIASDVEKIRAFVDG